MALSTAPLTDERRERNVEQWWSVYRQLNGVQRTGIQGMLRELKAFRQDVTERLLAVPSSDDTWQMAQLRDLRAELSDAITGFEKRGSEVMRDTLTSGSRLGVDATVTPVEMAMEADLDRERMFNLFEPQLQAAYQRSALMVKEIAETARQAIDEQLRKTVYGQQKTLDARRNIVRYCDIPERATDRFGPLAYQAARIVHTELANTYELASQAAQGETMRQLPLEPWQKIWLHSGQSVAGGARPAHAALHGTAVGKDEFFNVNGYPAMGPHDPNLPASEIIFCRCTSILWNPLWGPYSPMWPPNSDMDKEARGITPQPKPKPAIAPMAEAVTRDKRGRFKQGATEAGLLTELGRRGFAVEVVSHGKTDITPVLRGLIEASSTGALPVFGTRYIVSGAESPFKGMFKPKQETESGEPEITLYAANTRATAVEDLGKSYHVSMAYKDDWAGCATHEAGHELEADTGRSGLDGLAPAAQKAAGKVSGYGSGWSPTETVAEAYAAYWHPDFEKTYAPDVQAAIVQVVEKNLRVTKPSRHAVEEAYKAPRGARGRFVSTGATKGAHVLAGAPAEDSMTMFCKNGVWEPGRQRLHDDIVSRACAGVGRSARPTVYMTGGGTASGKSSLLGRFPKDVVKVDADAIKAQLPEYAPGVAAGESWIATHLHEESSVVSKDTMKAGMAQGSDVVYDSTGDSSPEKLGAKVVALRSAGYRVVADYAVVSAETAIKRADSRGAQTGRYVPHEVVRASHDMVGACIRDALAKGAFDELRVFDTSGASPSLMAEQIGGVLTVHDQARWSAFLAGEL